MAVAISKEIHDNRRSLGALLRPLENLAEGSQHLFTAHASYQSRKFEPRLMPRFLFVGPRGGGQEYFRLGIFAGIHGDEIAGIHAVVDFLEQLERNPDLAGGYELFIYPVCNPEGYAAGTRWASSGKDLNREFWQNSEEPEVRALEKQIAQLEFHGIISLHSDDTSEGLYGFVGGHALTKYLLEPALAAAERILPRNFDRQIDNFQASNGIIEKGYTGILGAPPTQKLKPFELVFETPQLAPLDKQREAFCAGLQSILENYRVILSEGQNI